VGAGAEAFAVMEDDSVLCAECVHEVVGDGASAGPESMVHAWIDVGPGVRCSSCSESDDLGGWAA
jgi:hypothetical protein